VSQQPGSPSRARSYGREAAVIGGPPAPPIADRGTVLSVATRADNHTITPSAFAEAVRDRLQPWLEAQGLQHQDSEDYIVRFAGGRVFVKVGYDQLRRELHITIGRTRGPSIDLYQLVDAKESGTEDGFWTPERIDELQQALGQAAELLERYARELLRGNRREWRRVARAVSDRDDEYSRQYESHNS
jgi:hypothetical protein